MKALTDQTELDRLTAFCVGKEVKCFDFCFDDDITIFFLDGSFARLSTLGGVAIAELKSMTGQT